MNESTLIFNRIIPSADISFSLQKDFENEEAHKPPYENKIIYSLSWKLSVNMYETTRNKPAYIVPMSDVSRELTTIYPTNLARKYP